MGSDYFRVDRRDPGRTLRNRSPHIGIGANTVIRRAIIDKNVRIGKNVKLAQPRRTSRTSTPQTGSYLHPRRHNHRPERTRIIPTAPRSNSIFIFCLFRHDVAVAGPDDDAGWSTLTLMVRVLARRSVPLSGNSRYCKIRAARWRSLKRRRRDCRGCWRDTSGRRCRCASWSRYSSARWYSSRVVPLSLGCAAAAGVRRHRGTGMGLLIRRPCRGIAGSGHR